MTDTLPTTRRDYLSMALDALAGGLVLADIASGPTRAWAIRASEQVTCLQLGLANGRPIEDEAEAFVEALIEPVVNALVAFVAAASDSVAPLLAERLDALDALAPITTEATS